jgi:FtsP/CotA-like multicopper oxidase with cupredoxin domain
VDEHELSLVASDGFDLEPYTAESFVIWPGERFDFLIIANRPIGNYWVRAELLATNNIAPVAEAILRYDGASDIDPTSTKATCTKSKPCIIANCPYPYFPQEHVYCKPFSDMKSRTENPAPEFDETSQNYFLNFGFPGNDWRPGSVNGRTFESPTVNALTQPKQWQSKCDRSKCGDNKICKCTYALKFNGMDGQRTIQMVLSSLGIGGNDCAHPIHVHGHSFHVIKQGFGQYNETAAQFIYPNTDIDCRGDPDPLKSFCNNAKWANKDWTSGKIPGAELKRAPIKDTITVPGGGYTVIRFKADNPGLWLMHCHMDPHDMAGMRFLLNETFSQIPKVPRDLPRCNSYPPHQTE